MEATGPKNQVTRTTHTPILTGASRGPALTLVEFKVDVPDEYVQFMWLKKYAPLTLTLTFTLPPHPQSP